MTSKSRQSMQKNNWVAEEITFQRDYEQWVNNELNEQENKIPSELIENIINKNKFFKFKQRHKNNQLLSKLLIKEIKKDALLLGCRTKSKYEKKTPTKCQTFPSTYVF